MITDKIAVENQPREPDPDDALLIELRHSDGFFSFACVVAVKVARRIYENSRDDFFCAVRNLDPQGADSMCSRIMMWARGPPAPCTKRTDLVMAQTVAAWSHAARP